MRRALIAMVFLVACASPPPTFALWQIDEAYAPNYTSGMAPERRDTVEVERGLDRAACELVLDKKARNVRTVASSLGATYTASEGGVIYHVDGRMRTTHFVCLAAGQRPPI